MVFCHTSIRVSHRNTHVPSSHLPPHPTLQPVTEPLLEFLESYSKCPLAIYFTYGVVDFYVTLLIHLPFSLLSFPCVHRSILCLFLHCCPENKFISAVSLDSIYVCQYTIFIFFSLTYFTLYSRL